MALWVKICGLKTLPALDAALDAGADHVGFVFFPPSPRHLGPEDARPLGARVRGRAQKVAVFVDADDALLTASVEALRPDMLQLHGREAPERVSAIKGRFRLPVMKALPVKERADLAAAGPYVAVADRLMFDARAPEDATRPGGHGLSFDWRLLQDIAPGLPFMLSGGLHAGNVAEAVRITRADGVDVSSGVERAPGEKDLQKIADFVRAARAAGVASVHAGRAEVAGTS
jgi:phosphoribosylanthranilate isomerase